MTTHEQTYPPFISTTRRLRSAFWRRRVIYWMVRAAWLSLLVPMVVMAGYLWLGWQVSWWIWIPLTILVGIVVFLWSLRPINLKKMTRRVDDALDMQAQLITAYEVSDDSNPAMSQENNLVVDQLIQNSVRVAVELRRRIDLFDRGFWIELRTLIAVAAILGAMLVLDALSSNVPDAPPVQLPVVVQEPRADQVIPPPPVPEQPEGIPPENLMSALQILADALRDHSVTRSISEAIDRGDLPTAATDVRRVADQLDNLSEDARRRLGDDMQKAADNIGDGAPDLTQPLEKGNQALDTGDLRGAAEALEELADVLDNIDEPPPSALEEPEKQEQENDNSPQQSPEEERLPIDGQDLELESGSNLEDQILQPSQLNNQNNSERTSDKPPFAKQPLNPPSDDLGPDPLTYPWEKRNIVREYFTPSEDSQ